MSIAGDVIHNKKFEEKFKLHDFHIVTGINIIPTAVVRLVPDGKDFITSETGVGPVDAVSKSDPEDHRRSSKYKDPRVQIGLDYWWIRFSG